jgi:hypothetical protein
MPICRTCKGQYDDAKLQKCPRCGSDLSAWDEFNTTLRKFVTKQGGVFGLLPAAAAIAVWLWWIPPKESGNYFPVLTLVSVGACALVFFSIYFKYFYWWEHWWARQIYHVSPLSIDLVITVAAMGGLLLTPLWVLFYTTVGRPVEFTHKALFALIYVPSFVCLTAAITLAVISEYVAILEKRAPPPIFVSTERLLRVVVNAAITDINLPGVDANTPTKCADTPAVYEVLQTLRIPENGGIHVLLRECKCVEYPGTDGKNQKKLMEMLWRIQADRWGRVEILRPGSLEPFGGERRDFRQIGRYSY